MFGAGECTKSPKIRMNCKYEFYWNDADWMCDNIGKRSTSSMSHETANLLYNFTVVKMKGPNKSLWTELNTFIIKYLTDGCESLMGVSPSWTFLRHVQICETIFFKISKLKLVPSVQGLSVGQLNDLSRSLKCIFIYTNLILSTKLINFCRHKGRQVFGSLYQLLTTLSTLKTKIQQMHAMANLWVQGNISKISN